MSRCRAEHGHRQLGSIQLQYGLAVLVRNRMLPGSIRKQGQDFRSWQRSAADSDGYRLVRGGCVLRCGGDPQENLRVVDQPVLGRPPGKLASLTDDGGHAIPSSLHEIAPVRGPRDLSHAHPAQQGGDCLVPRGLPHGHALHAQRVGQRPGRLDLQAIGEHGQAYPATPDGIVAMHRCVDDRLEDRLLAVLWHVDPHRSLSGGDMHVAHRERHCVRDLARKWTGDFLRVHLAGRPVRTAIPGRRDRRVGQPPVRPPRAQQYSGNRHALNPEFVLREHRELRQRCRRVGGTLGAEQGQPQLRVQGVEPGLRHRLLIEPEVTGLSAPLRQPELLFRRHPALGRVPANSTRLNSHRLSSPAAIWSRSSCAVYVIRAGQARSPPWLDRRSARWSAASPGPSVAPSGLRSRWWCRSSSSWLPSSSCLHSVIRLGGTHKAGSQAQDTTCDMRSDTSADRPRLPKDLQRMAAQRDSAQPLLAKVEQEQKRADALVAVGEGMVLHQE